MKAHGELSSGQFGIGRTLDVGQLNRIAVHEHAWSDSHAMLTTIESHWPIRSRNYTRAARLHPDEQSVEVHGLGAKRIRESEPHLRSPEIRSHDQPKCLIAGASWRGRERKLQVRRRRRKARRIRAVRRSGPGRD